MPKALLMTGASGFVGANAINFVLRNGGYGVTIATDVREPEPGHPLFLKPSSELTTLKFILVDITNPRDIEKLKLELKWLSSRDYEIVIWHMGGVFNYSASRKTLYDVNVLGTRNLLEMLVQLGFTFPYLEMRFVFWSGGVRYGDFNHPQGKLPATEEYPGYPNNDYGWTKKEAEDWIMHFHREFGLPVTIMRLGAIYGPYNRYSMGSAIILQAKGQLEPVIVGNGNNRTAMIHAEDVVRVANFLGGCPEADGEVYNVVDKTPITLGEQAMFLGSHLRNTPFKHFRMPKQVFQFLIWLTKRKSKFLKAETIIDPGFGEIILLNAWMSNEKLMELARKYGVENTLLKYPRTLDGLRQTICWFKEEGWI